MNILDILIYGCELNLRLVNLDLCNSLKEQ